MQVPRQLSPIHLQLLAHAKPLETKPLPDNQHRARLKQGTQVTPHTMGFESVPEAGFLSLAESSIKNLRSPIIAQMSWINRQSIQTDLAALIQICFPKGASIINLGSSTGSSAHGLAMTLADNHGSVAKQYPIHQIDFDPKTILLAKKNLISAYEHFVLHHNAPESKTFYEPVSWQTAMKDVPHDIQNYYAKGVRELILGDAKEFIRDGRPFQKDFHDLTGHHISSYTDVDQIKKMPIFQLKPELRKTFTYETADIRDWARSYLNFKEPVVVLAMNVLYNLTDKDQLSSLQALYKKLKSGSLLVISKADTDYYPQMPEAVKQAGFTPIEWNRYRHGKALPSHLRIFVKDHLALNPPSSS